MYPKPCANCARILRPGRTTIEEYPGTEAVHHAKGLCGACYRKPNREHYTYPRPCESCNRMMRPRRATPHDYPTAVVGHQAHGMCSTCYQAHWNYRGFPDPARLEENIRLEQLRHENTVAGLEKFMRRIRGKSRV